MFTVACFANCGPRNKPSTSAWQSPREISMESLGVSICLRWPLKRQWGNSSHSLGTWGMSLSFQKVPSCFLGGFLRFVRRQSACQGLLPCHMVCTGLSGQPGCSLWLGSFGCWLRLRLGCFLLGLAGWVFLHWFGLLLLVGFGTHTTPLRSRWRRNFISRICLSSFTCLLFQVGVGNLLGINFLLWLLCASGLLAVRPGFSNHLHFCILSLGLGWSSCSRLCSGSLRTLCRRRLSTPTPSSSSSSLSPPTTPGGRFSCRAALLLLLLVRVCCCLEPLLLLGWRDVLADLLQDFCGSRVRFLIFLLYLGAQGSVALEVIDSLLGLPHVN